MDLISFQKFPLKYKDMNYYATNIGFAPDEELKLREWPLKIYTLATAKKLLPQNMDGFFLFISSAYDDNHVLCSLTENMKSKYVIAGDPNYVAMAALILDSYSWNFQFPSKGAFNINIRTIMDIVMPKIERLNFDATALLELFILLSKRELNESHLTKEESHSISVLLSFLLLVRNYYVEELYIPEEYASRNVSVVRGWREFIKYLPDPNNPDIKGDLLAVFDCMMKNGDDLIEAFNKMKVYQIDTIQLFHSHLAKIH